MTLVSFDLICRNIYAVNNFFVSMLPIQNVKSFMFIHQMTFSLAWPCHRPVMASKFGISAIHYQFSTSYSVRTHCAYLNTCSKRMCR